ncbi:hypothetical protein GcM3_117008 [Golovinomyces cichoracearum]|uniref:Uncharacterized protein n=1 Tax=Golovinomyces cichoracearum TaxID=62708 RepID=A0A420I7Q2_9PEZI|nr:hypothetical protein GcM3_117008 [Golovinomyces cichoracearum]
MVCITFISAAFTGLAYLNDVVFLPKTTDAQILTRSIETYKDSYKGSLYETSLRLTLAGYQTKVKPNGYIMYVCEMESAQGASPVRKIAEGFNVVRDKMVQSAGYVKNSYLKPPGDKDIKRTAAICLKHVRKAYIHTKSVNTVLNLSNIVKEKSCGSKEIHQLLRARHINLTGQYNCLSKEKTKSDIFINADVPTKWVDGNILDITVPGNTRTAICVSGGKPRLASYTTSGSGTLIHILGAYNSRKATMSTKSVKKLQEAIHMSTETIVPVTSETYVGGLMLPQITRDLVSMNNLSTRNTPEILDKNFKHKSLVMLILLMVAARFIFGITYRYDHLKKMDRLSLHSQFDQQQ